jgi:hypothetical protein
MFVFFQQYTNHVYKTHEIYIINLIKIIRIKTNNTNVCPHCNLYVRSIKASSLFCTNIGLAQTAHVFVSKARLGKPLSE